MKSVGDLLDVDLPLLWHEAVALVQEVASHVPADGGIPSDKDLLIHEDGTITFEATSPAGMPAVTALSRFLQRLLPADAPVALRALASENAGEQPTHPTLSAFTAALAFFERPGRAAHLVGVATRLQQYTPPPSTEDELVRLRKKVIDAPEEPQPKPPAAKYSIRPAYVVAGVALAIIAVIVTVGLPVGPVVTPVGRVVTALSNMSLPATAPSSSTAAAPNTPDTPNALDASDATSGTAPHAAHGDTVLLASHRTGADRRQSVSGRAASSGQAAVITLMDGPSVVATSSKASDGTPADSTHLPTATAPAAEAREMAPRLDRTKIYSSEDTSVTPAALVRPQLPSEPVPGPDTGLFDLTVDESGTVVRVRLLSPAERFEERSLVSAAKAWRFRPALLDGHPVKYRLRVPINVPGQQ
jgi:hypothetical protein